MSEMKSKTIVMHPDDYIALKQMNLQATPVERIGSFFYGVPLLISEHVPRDGFGFIERAQRLRNRLDSMAYDAPSIRWFYLERPTKAQRRRAAKRFIREELWRRRMAKLHGPD